MEPLPKIKSCFGVIIEENQIPPRIYLVHNNADPLGPNGEKGKPAGFGPPGGGGEKGETALEAAITEVKNEIGVTTIMATHGEDSEAGEILFESKPVIDINTGKPAINEIYIFHLRRKDDSSFEEIKETDETGRLMLATFGSILTMPLARKIIKGADGSTTVVENPEGIYFAARERFFGVAYYLGYDFYRLIPNLDEVFPKINREDVGNYIYNLLAEAIQERNEVVKKLEEAKERRARFLRPDLDDTYEFQEIIDRYTDLKSWQREEMTYVSRGR